MSTCPNGLSVEKRHEPVEPDLQTGYSEMLTYRAMYKFVNQGVHAEVLDYPGVLSCAETLEDARKMLQGALVDMAETSLLMGEPLPIPDPTRRDPASDLEEPIHFDSLISGIRRRLN